MLDWLDSKGCVAGLVRQISNPLAATDTTLLSLAGIGYSGNHRFGFASCDRVVGASEGMNVLVERRTPGGCAACTHRAPTALPAAPSAATRPEPFSTPHAPSSHSHRAKALHKAHLKSSPRQTHRYLFFPPLYCVTTPPSPSAFEYNVSCIEYTEFDRLGIVDVPLELGSASSAFPANTNVLYAQLEARRREMREAAACLVWCSGCAAAVPRD